MAACAAPTGCPLLVAAPTCGIAACVPLGRRAGARIAISAGLSGELDAGGRAGRQLLGAAEIAISRASRSRGVGGEVAICAARSRSPSSEVPSSDSTSASAESAAESATELLHALPSSRVREAIAVG